MLAVLAVVNCGTASAAILHVPADYADIGSAVGAAASGDTVQVADGTYLGPQNRNIHIVDKSLTIQSAKGPELCVIDCENSGQAFICQSSNTDSITFSGIRFVNCIMAGFVDGGGAIKCTGISTTIANCLFRNCRTDGILEPGGIGGAVYLSQCAGTRITDCDFVDCTSLGGGAVAIRGGNTAVINCVFDSCIAGFGGAVDIAGGDIQITSSTFLTNSAFEMGLAGGGFGGAVYCEDNNNTSIVNCTFALNRCLKGSSVFATDTSTLTFEKSILSFSRVGAPVIVEGQLSSINISCSNVYGNRDGDWVGSLSPFQNQNNNFSDRPGFCYLGQRDLSLFDESTCLAVNSPCGAQVGAFGLGSCVRYYQVFTVAIDGTGDFTTIQDALDVAFDGDTVLLSPGVYSGPRNQELNFGGKTIVLTSVEGPRTTVLDLQQLPFRGFDLSSGEEQDAVISGITITKANLNPVYLKNGAGFQLVNASPTIENVCMVNNVAQHGTGVFSRYSDPVIKNVTIASNIGDAFYFWNSSPTISHTLMVNNLSWLGDPGICRPDDSTSTLTITCSNFFGNAAGDWNGCIAGMGSINGNMSLEPLFCDTANGDFRIDQFSPCAPGHALNQCGQLIGALGTFCQNCEDLDADSTCDVMDNCLGLANPDQHDANGDGIGDACCCQGMTGDVDEIGGPTPDIGDLAYMVDWMFRYGVVPACPAEADVNSDLSNDVADLTYLVGYVFKSGPVPASCP